MQSHPGQALSKHSIRAYRYAPCSMTPTRPWKKIVTTTFRLLPLSSFSRSSRVLLLSPFARRRYRPFSFNYTTEAMIDTRLIVFVQKPLHASWCPMSATKCSALPSSVRVYACTRLNNDDGSRVYMYTLTDRGFMRSTRPFYDPRNAITGINLSLYNHEIFPRILMEF